MIKQHERPKMLVDKALFVSHKLLNQCSFTQSSHGRNTEYRPHCYQRKVPNLIAPDGCKFQLGWLKRMQKLNNSEELLG